MELVSVIDGRPARQASISAGGSLLLLGGVLLTLGLPLLAWAADATSPAPGRLRLTPPEIVAEALTLPTDSALSGRPLPLLAVVAARPDRSQQAEAVHVYWRLVECVARYRFCLDHQQQLARIREKPQEAAEMRAARAASTAQLHEAQLEATAAQHELAALVMMPIDATLPLPADRPHVGPYRTLFAEMFSTGPAPDRARLIDRTLPLRARVIDAHAAAVEAAQDALSAAMETQAAGDGRLSTTIACLDEQLRQRRAMIAAVCRYNHDIADYAMTVIAPGAPAESLVGMLIRLDHAPAPPVMAGETDGHVRPATYEEPAGAVPAVPGKNWPTRAVRPTQPPAADPATPSTAPRQPAPRENRPGEPTRTPYREFKPILDSQDSTGNARSRTSFKPADGATPSGPLTSALAGLPPAERAVQLAAAMHRDAALSPEVDRPMSLQECLVASTGADHGLVLSAYWLARQRAAQRQAIGQQTRWLDELTPGLPNEGPRSASSSVRLQAARLASQTAELEAQLDLIEAQFELARTMGRPAGPTLPLPVAVPFAGQYAIDQAAIANSPANTWPLRRLKSTIPALGENVRQRAVAVVEADVHRAATTRAFQAASEPPDRVLDAVRSQSEQTSAFLQALTEYNRAIGQYALATLLPNSPADKFPAAPGGR